MTSFLFYFILFFYIRNKELFVRKKEEGRGNDKSKYKIKFKFWTYFSENKGRKVVFCYIIFLSLSLPPSDIQINFQGQPFYVDSNM